MTRADLIDRANREAGRRGDFGTPYWNDFRVAFYGSEPAPETIAQALEQLCAKQTSPPPRLPVDSYSPEAAE